VDRIRITAEPLDATAVEALVTSKERGAVVTFSGVVRDRENGSAIAAIVYEAYEAMALKELDKIADSEEERTGARIAVHHRVGEVPVGEASVIVSAGAGHRPQAFDACRAVIDRLKIDVPIWKASFSAPVRSPL
jgi:molybdopterin synthase catalytic subunit